MRSALETPFVVVPATALVTVLLHWGLGWAATPLAGVLAGLWSGRWHWWAAAVGGGVGWAASLLYSAAVAPGAFRVLLDTLGALAGNISGEALVALPVLLGSLLGGLGGGIGRCLRLLLWAD